MKILLFILVSVCYLIVGQKYKVAITTDIGSCAKCVFIPSAIIESYPSNSHLQVVAFLKCRRAKDTLIFKKNYNWDYLTAIDTLNLTNKYPEKNLFVLNESDSILYAINTFDPNFKKQKLFFFLDSLINK